MPEAKGLRALHSKAPPARSGFDRAVFFDMDDTLFDHTSTCESALRSVVQATKPLQAKPFPELFEEYSRLLEEIQPEVLAGKTTHERAREERFQALYTFCGSEVTARVARATSNQYRERYQAARAPVPGTPQLLEALAGRATIGIISNNQHREQVDKLHAIGLTSWVNLLITSEEAGVGKPAPEIFSLALDRAKVQPREAIMVGDNWAVDIEGALGVGMPAIWFNRWGRSAPRRIAVPEFASLDPSPFLLEALLGPGAVEI